MKTEGERDVLFYVSRATIIAPLIILVLGLFVFVTQKKQSPTTSPTPTKTPKLKTLSDIDLTGPMKCNFSYKDSSVSAQIKNKKVYAEVIDKNEGTTYYLLNEDCLYSWDKIKPGGKKTCGISTLLSFSGLLGGMKNIPILQNDRELDRILRSCKKEGVDNEKIFEIPKKPWL